MFDPWLNMKLFCHTWRLVSDGRAAGEVSRTGCNIWHWHKPFSPRWQHFTRFLQPISGYMPIVTRCLQAIPLQFFICRTCNMSHEVCTVRHRLCSYVINISLSPHWPNLCCERQNISIVTIALAYSKMCSHLPHNISTLSHCLTNSPRYLHYSHAACHPPQHFLSHPQHCNAHHLQHSAAGLQLVCSLAKRNAISSTFCQLTTCQLATFRDAKTHGSHFLSPPLPSSPCSSFLSQQCPFLLLLPSPSLSFCHNNLTPPPPPSPSPSRLFLSSSQNTLCCWWQKLSMINVHH